MPQAKERSIAVREKVDLHLRGARRHWVIGPATGRRIAWDAVSIVQVKDGRVVGMWAQPDLWSIFQQLTGPA